MVSGNYKKILIVNLGGIGDVLLSLAGVRALRERYKDATLDIMCIGRAKELAARSGFFDTVYVFSGRIPDSIRLLTRLRQRGYDLAVNMRTMVNRLGAFKMFLLLFFINAEVWAGRDTEGRGDFFDIKIPETWLGDKFEADYDIELAEKLGATVTDRSVRAEPSAESVARVKDALRGAGVPDGGVIVGINPGGQPSHRWPLERFAETMRRIAGQVTCSFVVTGGREESLLADALIRVAGVNAVNMAGKLSLDELAALMKRCSVFISNDTAAMHIAAALNVPLVAIFGPGFLKRFDPRTVSARAKVLYKAVPCAPCNKKTCGSRRCLAPISPDEVAEAAMSLLRPDRKGSDAKTIL